MLTDKKSLFCRQFQKIDVVGPELNLEHEGAQRFRSSQGACVSLSLFLVIIALCFLFGKEIYERKLPFVTISTEIIETSKVYLKEFPIMFNIQNLEGHPINNFEKYFDSRVFKTIMDDDGKVYNSDEVLSLKQCEYGSFTLYSDLVKKYMEKEPEKIFLCVDFSLDTYFQNEYYSLNSSNINIGFKKCTNNTSSNKFCAPDDEIESIGLKSIIGLTYLSTFVDFTIYQTPMYNYLEHFKTRLSDELLKRTYMRFVRNIFVSDIGWLIEDNRYSEYMYLQSIVPDDMIIIKLDNDFKNYLYMVSLESPRLRQRVFRNYMKVQELLSKIGGLVNALVVGTRLLMYPYLRYIYLYLVKEIAIDEIASDMASISKMNSIFSQEIQERFEKFRSLNQSLYESNKSNLGIPLQDSNLVDLGIIKKKKTQIKPENNQSNNDFKTTLAHTKKKSEDNNNQNKNSSGHPKTEIISEMNIHNNNNTKKLFLSDENSKNLILNDNESNNSNVQENINKKHLKELNQKINNDESHISENQKDLGQKAMDKEKATKKLKSLKIDKHTEVPRLNKNSTSHSKYRHLDSIDNATSLFQVKALKRSISQGFCKFICSYFWDKKHYKQQNFNLRIISNLLSIKQFTSLSMNFHRGEVYKEKTMKESELKKENEESENERKQNKD